MKSDKDRYDELYNVIYSLMDEEDYDDLLDQMMDEDLKLNERYQIDLNHSWYCIGDIFFKRLEFAKAITAFKNSVEYRFDDTQALLALGNSYSEFGLHQQALRCFATICEAEPMNNDARFNLAGVQMDIGNYLEAAENLKLLKLQSVDVGKNLNICLEKIAVLRKADFLKTS